MSGLIGGSIGFGLSIILRLELALPGFLPCSSAQYNRNITFHGIFMIHSMIMQILSWLTRIITLVSIEYILFKYY